MTPTLLSPCRLRRLGSVVAVAAVFPATALGAETPGPKVIRIDASTGAKTVLAGGGPWTSLSSIAVGPSGTVYVADHGGIYSLAAPGFTVTRFTTVIPSSLTVSGTTLFAGGSTGVSSIDTNPPFTQTVLSPESVGDLAISGSTAYTTVAPDCVDGGHNAKVVAIDTATGARTEVGDLGCAYPSGIVAAPDGTLLIGRVDVNGSSTGIVRFNPATRTVTPVATGGKLRSPSGIALTASGDFIVADSTSGVLRISPASGKQTTIASGGDFTQARAVALDPSGNIYVTASGTATLKATAKARQRFSKGIRVSASCRPRCSLAYRMEFPDETYAGTGFVQTARPGST
ncbi:MAG TPA: hypothetical protein VI300_02670, partial [Solirubrobacter sp.]